MARLSRSSGTSNALRQFAQVVQEVVRHRLFQRGRRVRPGRHHPDRHAGRPRRLNIDDHVADVQRFFRPGAEPVQRQ